MAMRSAGMSVTGDFFKRPDSGELVGKAYGTVPINAPRGSLVGQTGFGQMGPAPDPNFVREQGDPGGRIAAGTAAHFAKPGMNPFTQAPSGGPSFQPAMGLSPVGPGSLEQWRMQGPDRENYFPNPGETGSGNRVAPGYEEWRRTGRPPAYITDNGLPVVGDWKSGIQDRMTNQFMHQQNRPTSYTSRPAPATQYSWQQQGAMPDHISTAMRQILGDPNSGGWNPWPGKQQPRPTDRPSNPTPRQPNKDIVSYLPVEEKDIKYIDNPYAHQKPKVYGPNENQPLSWGGGGGVTGSWSGM